MSRIELTRKWWAANRPKDLKSPELDKALAGVEQAEGEDRLEALASVPGAITKLVRSLDKKAHKELLKSLDGLKALVEVESKKAADEAKPSADAKAKAAPSDDQEPETPEDKLFAPAFIAGTIRKALRGPIIFGFAIGSKPEQSALAVGVRGSPKNMARLAKTRSQSMKACCGRAQADENDPKTLTLSLDGPPLGGVARALRKYLELQKISVFRKVRVLVDGKEIEADGGEEGAPEEPFAQSIASSDQAASSAEPTATTTAPPAEQEMEVLEDRRRNFKKARAAWVAAKTQAEMDLEKVKDGRINEIELDAGWRHYLLSAPMA